MTELSVIEKKALELSLNKLFNQNFFSVCTIDKVSKMTGVIIPARIHNFLDVLHCVHYNEMEPEFLQNLKGVVHSIFLNPEKTNGYGNNLFIA